MMHSQGLRLGGEFGPQGQRAVASWPLLQLYHFPAVPYLPAIRMRAFAMQNKAALCATVAFSVLLLASAESRGQGYPAVGRPGYYQPARPTLSPYLDYFRRDTGATNPYYTFIQPYRQLSSALNQQGAAISNLSRQLNQATASEGIVPTGTGSVFMNYSHYYPMAQGARRR